MARAVSTNRKLINTAIAWTIGLLIFFPILWTILTSFKTEAQAISDPPVFLFFDWTLENYAVVQERSNYMRFLWNSIIIAGGSTVLGLIIAVPAAWSMAFVPSKRTKDILLWMLSTKMLPAVGVLYPIYLIFIDLGLLAQLPLLQQFAAQLVALPNGSYTGAALLSQLISNVPAAIFLQHFTDDWRALSWGVSVGGFGLAIGSLANLIALRLSKQPGLWREFHYWSLPVFAGSLLLGWLLS